MCSNGTFGETAVTPAVSSGPVRFSGATDVMLKLHEMELSSRSFLATVNPLNGLVVDYSNVDSLIFKKEGIIYSSGGKVSAALSTKPREDVAD